MKIVIDIPEKTKEQIIALTNLGESFPPKLQEYIVRAIINGTPLSKSHGRLIDADKLTYEINYGDVDDVMAEDWYDLYDSVISYIENAETIIEADKEGEK